MEKTKIVFKTQFVKEIKNMQDAVFSFQFSKVNEKCILFMNLSHLMS